MRIFYKPYIETQSLTNGTSKTGKENLPFKRTKPYVSLLYLDRELVTQQGAQELKARPPMILSEVLGTTSKAAPREQRSTGIIVKVTEHRRKCFPMLACLLQPATEFSSHSAALVGLAAQLGYNMTRVSQRLI